MDKLSLDVYLLGETSLLEPVLASVEPITYTTWAFHANAPSAPLPWNAVVIAATLDELAPYEMELPQQGMIGAPKLVLAGGSSAQPTADDRIPANLMDIWPDSDDPALIRRCFYGLMANVRAAYDAWLYRTFLFAGMDNLPGMVWFKNKEGLHNLVNTAFCETVNKTREDIKDREHNYIWDVPDDDPEAYNCDDSEIEVMSTREQHLYDEALTTAGGMKQLQVFKSPIFGMDGSVIGTVGYGNDVTDFTNMSRQVEILVENLPFSVVMCDRNFNVIRIDQSFRKEFGLGQMAAEDFDYLAWRDALKVVAPSESDHTSNPPFVVQRDDGPHFYALEEHEIIDYFGNPSGYYCVVRDVTLEHNYDNRLHRLANTDDLTHVANRRAFYKYLEARSREPLCVFFFDLDNFKRVNDTIGHATGDDVLVDAARTIEECIPDGYVARLGGDEFACALPGVYGEDEAHALGDKVREKFVARVAHLGLGVDVSYGVMTTDGGGMSVDDILGTSDALMYVAKKRHHDRD